MFPHLPTPLFLLKIPPALVAAGLAFAAPLLAAEETALDESDEAWLDGLLSVDEEALFDFEPPSPEPQLADMEAALADLAAPLYEGALELGGGWKSNALLSRDGSVDSSFEQLAVDLFALRPSLSPDGVELLGLIYGEYRRYDSVPGLNGEYLAIARGEASRQLGAAHEGVVRLGATASEQAFDASLVDFEAQATTIALWSPEAQFELSRALAGAGRLGFDATVSQARYETDAENYSSAALGVSYERPLGAASQLRLRWESGQERYDERPARQSTGGTSPNPTEKLRIDNGRFDGEWALARTEGFWRKARSKVIIERECDAVGDFYARWQWQLRETAEWRIGEWTVAASAAYGKTRYDERRVVSDAAQRRRDTSWRWGGEIRRPLWEGLEGFASWEAVRKDSNESDYAYSSETVWLGARWSWPAQN